LDQYRHATPIDYQINLFREQLEIALDFSLPVIIHTRFALSIAMEIIGSLYQKSSIDVDSHRGVFHAFEGSPNDAEKISNLGFFIGIGGPITYPKADEKKYLVKNHLLSNILLETDAPFLPPQNHRGRRNEPAYLKDICDKIAEIRGESYIWVAEVTTSNAISLFQIGDFH
jgi:TatD DNase family protein